MRSAVTQAPPCCKRRALSPELRRAYTAPYNSWANRIATLRSIESPDRGPQAKATEVEADIELDNRKFEHEKEFDYAKLQHEQLLANQKAKQDAQLAADAIT